MTTIQQPAAVDPDKLMGFVFRAVDEVGATFNTALVVMGGTNSACTGHWLTPARSPRPGWPRRLRVDLKSCCPCQLCAKSLRRA